MTLKRILYAEDDVHIQLIAKMALERIGGFTVMACSSGKEALVCIDEFSPELLLLDVMMPDMDGPAVLQEVRQRPQFSSIPAIFMTAKIQPVEMDYYKSLGIEEVISKPFNSAELANQIQAVWNRLHD